jgi:hypothetical protein
MTDFAAVNSPELIGEVSKLTTTASVGRFSVAVTRIYSSINRKGLQVQVGNAANIHAWKNGRHRRPFQLLL